MKVTTRVKFLKHELKMLEEDLQIARSLQNYSTAYNLELAWFYFYNKIEELTTLYDIKEDK